MTGIRKSSTSRRRPYISCVFFSFLRDDHFHILLVADKQLVQDHSHSKWLWRKTRCSRYDSLFISISRIICFLGSSIFSFLLPWSFVSNFNLYADFQRLWGREIRLTRQLTCLLGREKNWEQLSCLSFKHNFVWEDDSKGTDCIVFLRLPKKTQENEGQGLWAKHSLIQWLHDEWVAREGIPFLGSRPVSLFSIIRREKKNNKKKKKKRDGKLKRLDKRREERSLVPSNLFSKSLLLSDTHSNIDYDRECSLKGCNQDKSFRIGKWCWTTCISSFVAVMKRIEMMCSSSKWEHLNCVHGMRQEPCLLRPSSWRLKRKRHETFAI